MTDLGRPIRTASRRWSWARTAIAVTTLAALTTACFAVEIDLVVRDDDSGSFTSTIYIDEAAVAFVAALGEQPSEDSCQQFIKQADEAIVAFIAWAMPVESTLTVASEGGCTLTLAGTWTTDDADAVLARMANDEGLRLSRLDDGGWRFELETGSFADEEFSLEDLELATAMGFDFPTLKVSVTLPGDPVEHNADSVNRSKYSWEVDLAATDQLPESLYVETAPSSGLGPAAIGGIVAGILLALAALVTLRRHQEAKAEGSSADDTESTTATAVDSTDDAGSTEL